MADEIVGWSIVAKLSVDDSEFRAKLRAAEQAIQQTRQAFASAGGGGSGGLGGFAGPSSQFFSGGGGGGGGGPTTMRQFGGGLPPPGGATAVAANSGGGGGGGAWQGFTPRFAAHTGPEQLGGGGAWQGGFSGPNQVAESRARAKALKDEENASKSNRQELGLRAAYMIRAATAGGAAGVAGGGLGALVGLMSGVGAGFGSVVGNQIGQAVGGMASQNAADVALGQPWMARQRQLAERDAAAGRGRAFSDTYAAGTQAERFARDFYAAGGKDVSGSIGNMFGAMGSRLGMNWTAKLAQMQGINVQAGAGAGLAPNDRLGRNIGGPEDVWGYAQRALSSQTPPNMAGGGDTKAAVEENTGAIKEMTKILTGQVPPGLTAAEQKTVRDTAPSWLHRMFFDIGYGLFGVPDAANPKPSQ